MPDLLWNSIVPVMQNRLYSSLGEALTCPIASLSLVWDSHSGLVYNDRFDPTLLQYGADYNNEQGVSPIFADHLSQVLAIIQPHLDRSTNVVEIGCGKGTFLNLLWENGIAATGFDPAYEGDEPHIQKRCFDVATDLGADFIILRHVLEHIPHPYGFLRQIAQANRGHGSIFIEVPDLSWIIEHRAFYDLFYEHCNYFTRWSLASAFNTVINAGTCFGDQYLWLIGDLASLAEKPRSDGARPDFSAVSGALASVSGRMLNFRRRFVWGAGAKGVTLAHILANSASRVDYLIDINPRKQGCFAPVSGTPIISPTAAQEILTSEDVVVMMNPQYQREIHESLPHHVPSVVITEMHPTAVPACP